MTHEVSVPVEPMSSHLVRSTRQRAAVQGSGLKGHSHVTLFVIPHVSHSGFSDAVGKVVPLPALASMFPVFESLPTLLIVQGMFQQLLCRTVCARTSISHGLNNRGFIFGAQCLCVLHITVHPSIPFLPTRVILHSAGQRRLV